VIKGNPNREDIEMCLMMKVMRNRNLDMIMSQNQQKSLLLRVLENN
jgi:hypothetical protein